LIAFQHNSNAVIQKMLELGGVDIYAINLKKATPYQLALNSQNEEGLQLLMKY
jgi:ankyrin repeat protein